jgi:hypothetical protein
MTFVIERQEYNHAMLLDLPLILETRRNHALEHATLHVLARTHQTNMAGHSNPTGFFLLGDLTTEEVTQATIEAWTRLNAGEHHLAVHPGCGTNLATNLVLASTLGWLPLRGRKSTLGRLAVTPLAILLALLGYAIGRELGPKLQEKITTEPRLGNMRITEVRLIRKGIHRIITR